MRQRRLVLLAFLAVWALPGTCFSKNELMERIKKVKDVAIWQRVPLPQKDLRKALQDLQSPDQKTMQDAYERLALSPPESGKC